MSATIADVARYAGVGVGTVSRVLNDQPKVSPVTRARVRAAIEALDYVPSTNARRLSSGHTGTIAVVSTHLVSPSVVERIRGIEQSLTRAGLDMIIRNVETTERRDEVVADVARTDRIDGALFISIAPSPAELAQIRRSELPVVLIDAHHRSVARVVCDDLQGGRIAARHLLDLGHTRISFLGDPPHPTLGVRSSSMRLRGATQTLEGLGFEIQTSYIGAVEQAREEARRSTRAVLSAPHPPTAVIAANDTLAFGALQAAHDLGIDVPGELSVIGYDDIEAADLVQLTTIHQPLYESGTRAVSRLLGIIDGTDTGALRTVLPVRLVVRGTTGPAPS